MNRIRHDPQGLAAACTFEAGIAKKRAGHTNFSYRESIFSRAESLLTARIVDNLATSGIETP
jgi:hypothetical protein